MSIERALGSFDLFVLHDQQGDLLEVNKAHGPPHLGTHTVNTNVRFLNFLMRLLHVFALNTLILTSFRNARKPSP